jgi:hypothetical protein
MLRPGGGLSQVKIGENQSSGTAKLGPAKVDLSTARLSPAATRHSALAMPTPRLLRPQLPLTQVEYVFSFLVPSVQFARSAPRSPVARFSTSPASWKRDNNRNRGLSVLRHTGLRPRQTLSVKTKKDFEAKVQGDEDHGLWGFFSEDKKLLRTPAEESQHGSESFLLCRVLNG